MKFKPHNYQRQAIAHILLHPNSVLLLDMGLGKTVITLTALTSLLTSQLARRVLIIAPKRVATHTWPTELAKWDHLAGLNAVVLTGTPATRQALLEDPAPLHIINRENVPWLVQTLGDRWDYDTVVIDELSSFKNASSKRNRALTRVRGRITRMIGLTGTPTSTGLLDLFGQYKVIDPTIFGTRITEYRDKYFQPTTYVYGRPVGWEPRQGAQDAIYEAIRPVTMSMTAEDYLDVPEAIFVNHAVSIPPKARTTYDTLKRDLVTHINTETIDATSAATLAGKLLQLSAGAIYTDPNTAEWVDVHNAKLDALEDLVEAANGQPLLVAYWYTHDLARIRERFPNARLLDTAQDFDAWNKGLIPIGLIHPASAGHGLNLQAGGHLIVWYTLTWSLELYQQLNARLHRQGQQHPVTITHLVAEDTIDARVLASLTRKDATQAALVDAVRAEVAA
ncbi:DEAD/DEAH box helicase [Trueperella pecoris]|uniref:DEAD/DEAH box helicase n=1 Tax=Trueperella pecoris TaxID=2733571 RepID=A0A7M1R221_9ACTO|nr:DEAD/DEAH box helicase [Trueperella pecoris]QOR47515.1 DEAD/DEAH box helicase [Trueperella pecoris]